jgi:hypothetical protein
MAKRKKIKKSNPVKLSILAHRRLADYHTNEYKKNGNNANAWIKSGYHEQCARDTEKLCRKLTRSEKEEVYRWSRFYWYN